MRYLLTYVLIVFSVKSHAQLHGNVFDRFTEEPLPAVVVISDENKHTITDSTGHFTIVVDTLPVVIKFISMGYKPFAMVVNKIEKTIVARLDVSEVNIDEITVSSTAFRQRLNRVPGHISVITESGIELDNIATINHSLNNMPGIYVQSGTFSTNRLIIRGIGSRTPYSTNRVKAYIEDIPLTTGEGVTTIEDIDPELIGKIEVIRGPASGIYGAGLGGAVGISAGRVTKGKYSASLRYTTGSFGLHKVSVATGLNSGKNTLSAGFNSLLYSGYRENNGTRRNSFYLFSHHHFNKSHLKIFLYQVSLHAYIPSSLSRDDYENNPQNASSNWLNIKGFEDYNKILAGATYNKRFRNNIYNYTTIFTSYFNQYESRPFNILKDKSLMYGIRTRFTYSAGNTSLALGTELFREHYMWDIFETLDGRQGMQLNENKEERFYYNIYLHSKFELLNNLTLTTGVNFNILRYDASHLLSDSTRIAEKHTFKPVLSPMAGINFKGTDAVSMYLLLSHGFSPPSVEETLNPEGLKNTNIKPESGWNIETGIRGLIAGKRLNYELSVYRMFVSNLLVTKRLTEDIFTGVNAGKTDHYGIEASISYHFSLDHSQSKSMHTISFSSYYTKNRFITFYDVGNDHSGKLLPGIPRYIFVLGFNRTKDIGLIFSVNIQHTGSMFLNDANTGRTDDYTLVNTKIIYKIPSKCKFDIDIFAGIYNLLNTHYASMILVNAPEINNLQPRYYYPGLPININGGIKVRFNN